MISAIKDFDEDRHESVNMRVGIHTGTVLCGIVGKTRFKFDVWSNDVTLANQMESTGRPGMVHISEKTYGFLKNDYLVEEGDVVGGIYNWVFLGVVVCYYSLSWKKKLLSYILLAPVCFIELQIFFINA